MSSQSDSEERATTPLVTTGRAAERWVKWKRSRGEEEPPLAHPGRHAAPGAELELRPSGLRPSEVRADRDVIDVPHLGVEKEEPENAEAQPPTASYPYVRPALLVIGALALQLAFVVAYLGGGHARVAVVDSSAARSFQADVGDAVETRTFTDRRAAFDALAGREVAAVLVANATGPVQLHIASATDATGTKSIADTYGRASTATGTPLEVFDDYPLPDTDDRGLAPFFLVAAWMLGGWLMSRARTLWQLGALWPLGYAVASGIGGAVVTGPVLGIWQTNLVPLATLGVLVVFAASFTAAALDRLFGAVVSGVTVLVLVVLGGPGASVPGTMWLLPGAATAAARSTLYFRGHGLVPVYGVLLLWCAISTALYLLALRRRPTT